MEYTKDKKLYKLIAMAVASAVVFISIDMVLISNFIKILSLM